jgi:hypothetical protein
MIARRNTGAILIGAAGAVLVVGALGIAVSGCGERTSPAAANVGATQEAGATTQAVNLPKDDAKQPRQMPIRDITFDNVKFNMQKDEAFKRSMITPAIEKLDRTPIRIRGYILPSFQQTGLTQFVLVRDNMECCFGPGAALYDCIVVEMIDGKTADFTTRPVAVEGVFSIQEVRGPDDRCLAIYHLDGEKVR